MNLILAVILVFSFWVIADEDDFELVVEDDPELVDDTIEDDSELVKTDSELIDETIEDDSKTIKTDEELDDSDLTAEEPDETGDD